MRYLPLTEADRAAMLAAVGAPSIDALFVDAPRAAYGDGPLDLPFGLSEIQTERVLTRMAAKSLTASTTPFFCGAGVYKHHVPAAVDHLIQRGEFLTAYTPYQPEIAQGTLQYLFEFQSQVALLTGMEVANASLYDGSTATVEAVSMANRVTKRSKALLCGGLHPHYADMIVTQGRLAGFTVVPQPAAPAGDELAALIAAIDKDTSCVVVQNPSFFGAVRDLRPVADACHAVGALLIAVVTEIVSLGAILPPGAMGADIVAAEGQSLGAGLNFGGPNVGLFAASEKLLRQMPGRLVGQTTDLDGRRGWVLTLSAREQHIRRDKATSNICTNSGLIALAFSIHLTLLGEAGLRQLAALNHAAACALADQLCAVPGVALTTPTFFNEFTLRLPKPAAEVVEALAKRGILGGVPVSRLLPQRADLADLLVVACTECATAEDMRSFADGLAAVLAR